MRMARPRAHELLVLAGHDLRAAEVVMREGESLNVVAFLAQQVAEKAVKAVLAVHDIDYPRTHDLASLLALARQAQPDATQFESDAEDLQEYGVTVRYDLELFPSVEEAHGALLIARGVLAWAETVVKSTESET